MGARVSTGSAVSKASALYEQRQKRPLDAIEKRFDVVGDGGGFILDPGGIVPDEAKPENVLAMYELAKECVY